MAKFFKDSDGKLVAALGDGVATPAGCTELTANTEDAARGLDGAPHAARALHRVDRA